MKQTFLGAAAVFLALSANASVLRITVKPDRERGFTYADELDLVFRPDHEG